MCLENEHWQQNLVKKNVGWKRFDQNIVFDVHVWHQFNAKFGVDSWKMFNFYIEWKVMLLTPLMQKGIMNRNA